MRVLVTGAGGFVGRELVRQAAERGDEVIGTSFSTRPQGDQAAYRRVDVRDRAAVVALLEDVRPELVVHTAYRHEDWSTTADGAAHVAVAAAAVGARLVHISSDSVFSGSAAAYTESAVPDPINAYGAAKAAAETAVRVVHPGAAIVRSSLVLGGDVAPFESLVHGLATGAQEGALFTDDIRCAVHVGDLAGVALEVADRPGMHHAGGADALSRMELGLLICARDRLPTDRLVPALRADLPVPGPLDVRLDSRATQARLSTRLRGAREFLAS